MRSRHSTPQLVTLFPLPTTLKIPQRETVFGTSVLELPPPLPCGMVALQESNLAISNDKGKRGQRSPRRDAIPFDSGRRGRTGARLMDSGKEKAVVSGPGFWPKSLAGTGPIFLFGIAILLGLCGVLDYRKSAAAGLKPDEQLRLGRISQSSSPVLPLSNPSPIPPAVTARPEGSTPWQTPNAGSTLSGFSTLHHPMRFEATRKKAFGGCTGELELTSAGLHFKCSNQADLDIPVGLIAKAHKDGVVLESGERYHFLIANRTKAQAEAIFILWLNRFQHFPQPSGKSSF